VLRVSYANAAIIEVELLEKVNKDIKERLEKHRVISSSTKETGLCIVDLFYYVLL